jgi:16S rRNA pseudouridine516 synthase
MRIADILFSQGFGTRRVCAGLVQQRLVSVAGRVIDDPQHAFDTEGLVFEVQGQGGAWPFRAKALLMLHKPAGYECSQRPGQHPTVMTLLPQPLRQRGVQPVGRLDVDTTGLLLLTDDGPLLHRLTSPKHHVPKVYEAGVKHDLDARQVERLLQGVVLDDDPRPVRAAAAHARAPRLLELTLTEGRYHQVKRMVAAVGNRVETLHRSRIGELMLPADLAPGQWRWLDAADGGVLGGR